MKNGWMLQGDHEKGLTLKKDNVQICFDIKVKTKHGVLFCALLKRHHVEGEVGSVALSTGNSNKVSLGIKAAHDRLGHCDEERTRATARLLNWNIVRGALPPCRDCVAGKARQRNVPKESDHVPTGQVNGRLYLDVSTIRGTSEHPVPVTNQVWLIKVDEATQMKFSTFHSSKNAIVESSCEQFKLWKQQGRAVKIIRCDNAGENKLLEQRANSVAWQLGISFEYTARNTPQQNSLAEVAFATIANRGRAMMHRANLPLAHQYKLCKEAFKTATLLDGLTVIILDGVAKTRVEHWSGKLPKFAMHLRTWGEAGTVTLKNTRSPKLADRGVQCMFVGYALNHEGDCYRMWDPLTNRVHITRDIIWLR
jgi:Integrase core domain.